MLQIIAIFNAIFYTKFYFMLKIKELREKNNLTQDELSELSGIKKRSLVDYENGKQDITISKLQNIATALRVSVSELLQDSPLKLPKAIPFVNTTAIGGFGNSKFAIEERDVKAYYVIPKFQHKKVDFMIEVEGSSMYPKYNSGDVVACRIINEKSFLQWNKTHVVATKDQGIIIKRIKQGSDGSLLMISDNKDYDPFPVPIDEIEGIALVVGVIRLE